MHSTLSPPIELKSIVAISRSAKKALEGIECRVLVMLCRTDQYFTVAASEMEIEVSSSSVLKVGIMVPL
jgi:hypothetical protein